MGVNMENVIMFGVKMDYAIWSKWEKEHTEEERKEIEIELEARKTSNKIGAIPDGNNGDYLMVGFVIIDTDKWETMELPFTKLPVRTEFEVEAIKQFVKKHFGIECKEPTYWAFTHYT